MTNRLFQKGKIGSLELRNRIIKAGCFEGMSQRGEVTPALLEHHRRIAEGGAGMITVAYCSVSYDGRAFDHELWMRPEIVSGLKTITDAVHEEGAAASIQLGHCGYFASSKVIGSRPLGASKKFNLFRLSICRKMTEVDIRQKIQDFVEAAVLARKAGFDAVEVHAGHGYLLSQFMSPYTNHRSDQYGGSLKNRMKFPVEVISGIRAALGDGFPILVKMNSRDGFSGGLELVEAIQAAMMFEKAGASGIIPSCGFTSKTPLYMLRGYVPVKEMVRNQKDFLSKTGLMLFGKTLVQQYPYTPLFLAEGTKKIKDALSIPVIYIGGVRNRDDIISLEKEGFEFVQVGRALIHDPDFVKKMETQSLEEPLCDNCNRCVAAMDAGGVYCVSKEKGYMEVNP